MPVMIEAFPMYPVIANCSIIFVILSTMKFSGSDLFISTPTSKEYFKSSPWFTPEILRFNNFLLVLEEVQTCHKVCHEDNCNRIDQCKKTCSNKLL